MVSIFFLPDHRKILNKLERFDIFAAILVSATILAAALNPNAKSLTYVALYSFSALFLGIIFRNAVAAWGARNFLNAANAWAIFGVSAASVLEFWSRYLTGHSPFSAFPLVNPPTSLCGIDLPRVYALSLEPTYLGWVLTSLGLVALRYVWTTRAHLSVKYGFGATLMFAVIVTWSTAAFACLAVASLAAVIYAVAVDRKALRTLPAAFLHGSIALVLAVAPLAFIPLERLGPCIGYAGQKVQAQASGTQTEEVVKADLEQRRLDIATQLAAATSENEIARLNALKESVDQSLAQLESGSAKAGMHRFDIWKHDFLLGMEKPLFGWGPGYNSSVSTDSSLNLPIFVFMEQGIFAAAALGIFLLALGWKMVRSQVAGKYIYFVAYAAGCLNLLTQTKHFHTNVWIVVALFWIELVQISADSREK